MSRELEEKPQTGITYLQKTHLIKNCYPMYIKNSEHYNNDINDLIKKWAKDLNRHLTKKMYRWQISI